MTSRFSAFNVIRKKPLRSADSNAYMRKKGKILINWCGKNLSQGAAEIINKESDVIVANSGFRDFRLRNSSKSPQRRNESCLLKGMISAWPPWCCSYCLCPFSFMNWRRVVWLCRFDLIDSHPWRRYHISVNNINPWERKNRMQPQQPQNNCSHNYRAYHHFGGVGLP